MKIRLWISNGGKWRKVPGFENHSQSELREVADRYNKKYITRHYYVSKNQPGEEQLEEVIHAKEEAGHDWIDSYRVSD